MRKKQYISFACLLCLILSSCAVGNYADTLSCSEVAEALVSEISPYSDYKSYSKDEIDFLLDRDIEYDDVCFMYSASSDDMSEIAVFHSEKAEDVFDELCEYAESLREEKRAFVQNYMPEELSKLNDGQARRFGNYVVLAIFEKSDRDAIFENAKEILNEK